MPPAYPGPFGNAPASIEVSGAGGFFVVPDVAPQTSTGGGDAESPVGDDGANATGSSADDAAEVAGDMTSPGLARTGSSPLLATTSVLLLTLGGVLLVASRRDDET